MNRKLSLGMILRSRMFLMLFLLVAMIIYFTISSNGIMLNPRNLVNIFNMMTISLYFAASVTLLMVGGSVDLSTGAIGTIASICGAYFMRDGMPFLPALLVTVVAGIICGLINGVLVNELRLAPFIVTLATTNIFTGVVYILANKSTIDVTNNTMLFYGQRYFFKYIPVSMCFAFIVFAIIGIVLHKTTFGRKIYMLGGNPRAAMLTGINSRRMSYILFSITGGVAGMAGLTLAARMGAATIAGTGMSRFTGMTAASLGGISLGGGSGGIVGCFVGVLVLQTFSNGLAVLGVNAYYQNMAQGVLLLFALSIDYFQRQAQAKGGT